MIKTIHSYWAYLVLFFLLIAVYRAISCTILKKEYNPKMFRVALITLIVSHTQILIAFLLYFTSNRFLLWFDLGLVEIIKTPIHRMYLVEHPIINIIAVVFITVGYSKHKKNRLSAQKYKTLALYYSVALVLILSRIPWSVWPN